LTDEQELRVVSDSFLARVERLNVLEGRKRELPAGSPDMLAAAHEVEALVGEILGWAKRQTDLAAAAAVSGDPDAPPIAVIPARDLTVVLAEWREAERKLDAQTPGTAAWESARADVDRLRDEYARAYQSRQA
jgi:hypothetical protein